MSDVHATIEDDGSIFKQLLDAAPDPTIVVDDEGVIVFANQQTTRAFGRLQAELLGQPVEILIPERFRSSHPAHRLRFTADPRARPMGSGLELFGLKQNGDEFPIEISLSPVSTPTRTLIAASIRDISERRLAESQMRRLQNQLLSAVESIQGAFVIFDDTDRMVLCNSTYRVMWGNDWHGGSVGSDYARALDDRISAGVFDLQGEPSEQFRERCLAYHRNPDGILDMRLRDGRTLRLFARRTADHGIVKTALDITDDVARERDLQQAQAIAEAASSAKSEFLASMSHELRTPLNAILGFAQLLQRDKKEPLSSRHRERIEHVLKGGEHLLRLIDDVLDLARIETGRVPVSLEPVNVEDVFREIEATLTPLSARAEITFRVAQVDDQLRKVIADRTRFKQVLMNFGSNAIKYGRAGGNVMLYAERASECLRVSVQDDGIGISQDQHDKIFSPFQRAGQETGPIEGTGIGLAISKRLAELMNGRVGFESAVGNGSTFWIELPIALAPPASASTTPRPSAKPAAPLQSVRNTRFNIIYIEDNPSNIAFMTDLMMDFEYVDLITAPNAELGIELVRSHKPSVVIMDINLPGMSGIEAVQRLAAWPETKHIPVIALSAAAMLRDAERLRGAGFYRYLTKPVKVDELTHVLEELLVS